MKKTLFHGSEHIIEKPLFGKGAVNNDYGKGFYCTEEIELAKEWACSKNTDGYANKYELNLDGLKVLNLNDKKYCILTWLAILAKHRTYWESGSISETAKTYLQEHFMLDLTGYDCIIGYRADDSYFAFAQDFVAGAISYAQLSEAMRLGKLGEQVVLKSEKAFKQIKYIESEIAHKNTYFIKKTARDKEARRSYRASKKNAPSPNDLFILDILREEIKNGDPRLY